MQYIGGVLEEIENGNIRKATKYIKAQTDKQNCYGLNICVVPTNAYVEALTCNVKIPGDGAFGREFCVCRALVM